MQSLLLKTSQKICLIIFILSSLFSSLFSNIFAQTFLWPTDASNYLTSSFGEFRTRRFHLGIDIKTWDRDGYKVFAAEKGWITRVKVGPFGYGRVVYLKHSNGYQTVYGHLSKFAPKIQNLIETEQERQVKFSVELFFEDGRLPVEKGELIAFTGHSGVGSAHLHFEIRDPQDRPHNPLLFGLKPNDTVASTPLRLSATPLDARSTVNGDWKPEVVGLVASGNQRYQVSRPIRMWGNIKLGIDCYDTGAPDIPNKFSPFSMVLSVDNQNLFQVNYNQCSFAANHLIELDRDYRLMRRGKGIFHNLLRMPGNILSMYGTYPIGSGTLRAFGKETGGLGAGQHQVMITLTDAVGNRSYVNGNIIVDETQEIDSTTVPIIKVVYAQPEDSDTGDSTVSVSDSVEIVEEEPTPLGNFKITEDWYDTYLRLEIQSKTSLRDAPKVTFINSGKNGNSLPVRVAGQDKYVSVCPLISPKLRVMEIAIEGIKKSGGAVSERIIVSRQPVLKSGGRLVSTDGNCWVSFGQGDLYRTLWGKIKILHRSKQKSRYDIGELYQISPGDVPFNDLPVLTIRYPASDPKPEKLGIFSLHGRYWGYHSGRRDPANHTISANVGSFAAFALVRDVQPPLITKVLPAHGSVVRNAQSAIEAHIADGLSGIGSDDLIDMRLDGKKVIFEYDPEAGTITHNPKKPLARGSHTVQITVRDNVNNVAKAQSIFTIKY